MKKIALEEHFWTDGFPHAGKFGADLFQPSFLSSIGSALLDFSDRRLAAMDQAGIEVSVLSLISPGVQAERDHARAVREAQRVNDFLAAEIDKHPTRYAGFAHLPMQGPEAATRSSNAACVNSTSRARSLMGIATAYISTMRAICRSGNTLRR